MAIISNGTTIASGGSVSYNRLTDTPTIPTNTNQLTNGAGYITSAPAPTTSQVLSATASASAGAVGTYMVLKEDSWTNRTSGATAAGSGLTESNAGGVSNASKSGTWRIMGYTTGSTNAVNNTTVWLRIS